MSPDREAPSLTRQVAPWVLAALAVVGAVIAWLWWTAPADNPLHDDYEIL